MPTHNFVFVNRNNAYIIKKKTCFNLFSCYIIAANGYETNNQPPIIIPANEIKNCQPLHLKQVKF